LGDGGDDFDFFISFPFLRNAVRALRTQSLTQRERVVKGFWE
jgi:hypothetical protein